MAFSIASSALLLLAGCPNEQGSRNRPDRPTPSPKETTQQNMGTAPGDIKLGSTCYAQGQQRNDSAGNTFECRLSGTGDGLVWQLRN